MTQSTLEKPNLGHKQSDYPMINPLKDAQIEVFSGQECTRSVDKSTQKRQLKPKRGPSYRRMNAYFKSRKQYKKERERRKRVRQLSKEGLTYPQIAEKLGVSEKTVYRDMKKQWPYLFGQLRRKWRMYDEEKQREYHAKMESMTLAQQVHFLGQQMELRSRIIQQEHNYHGHYTTFLLDLTQPDKYGIPKLTQLPQQTKGKPIAYPYKIRVRVKGVYEGREFTADIGGFNIVQTTGRGW